MAPIIKERAIEAAAAEAKRLSDCQAAGGHIDGDSCIVPPPPPKPVVAPVAAPVEAPGELTGSLGWSSPWGNCVNEPGVNNPGWGNPIDWPVLYASPHIGSTALFTFNHTAVVTGIWSNGDIEVAQENSYGPHRYPSFTIRGYR